MGDRLSLPENPSSVVSEQQLGTKRSPPPTGRVPANQAYWNDEGITGGVRGRSCAREPRRGQDDDVALPALPRQAGPAAAGVQGGCTGQQGGPS